MSQESSKYSEPIFSYLIPVVVGVLLAAIGYLYGLLKIESIVFSTLLIFAICLTVFLSELLLTRTTRIIEREQNFTFLSRVLFRQQAVGTRHHLSMDEVIALEQTASAVWIYAYDMKWEDGNSTLPDIVQKNLQRGVAYQYIVPNSTKVSVRVQALLAKHAKVRNCDTLIKFRTREHELKLIQFGITIYNPTIASHDHQRAQECVVVFFPHYEGLGTSTPDVRQFLALRGAATVEIQEGFMEAWQIAVPFQANLPP